MSGLCGFCKEHVKTRFLIKGTTYKGITNILLSNIKEVSDDELLEMYRFIKVGLGVCEDCIRLCKRVNSECDKPENMNIYSFRTMTDKKDLETIETEVRRRVNIRKILKKV